MTIEIRRPVFVPHARYRWDRLREQHQIVFPEGILVLNETAAAIVQLCDGRSTAELVSALREQFADDGPLASPNGTPTRRSEQTTLEDDIQNFLERLTKKGLLRDAADS
jgi:pyrroloquinoline quinone biosynthesis protein D